MPTPKQHGRALAVFSQLIGDFGEHRVRSGDHEYLQPYVYLSLHVVQMVTEGWDVDYDTVAAVSGASALYGHKLDDFMPKYAHLVVPGPDYDYVDPHVGPEQRLHGLDQRIAAATGFGYTWTPFEHTEDAWNLIVETVDAGHTARGWDWEGILFAGYQGAGAPQDRRVFAMADGPDTYARWLSWDEFSEWADRVSEWHQGELGHFAGRVPTSDPQEVARQVLSDLVAWSEAPPTDTLKHFAGATWGLAGIRRYASDCADVETNPTWVACHPINPQWTVRNCTSVYLGRVVTDSVFGESVDTHLSLAADYYHAAYDCWKAFYALLGHDVPEVMQGVPSRRRAAAAVVEAWAAHEEAALAEVTAALDLI